MRFSFGVLVNDIVRLDMVLRQSELDPALPIHTIKTPSSATVGMNKLLGLMEKDGADVGVIVHQDMFFRNGWLNQVEEQINLLPSSWVTAGIIGKDLDGAICGRFRDMRIPLGWNTDDLHSFPQPASCFDECVILVNLKKGFRFDQHMKGFDLYGTLAVCQTWEMGGTAFILDAYAEHYCMRPFNWFPDKQFERMFKWLHERFPNAPRIDTTVLGVPNTPNPPRYDKPAEALSELIEKAEEEAAANHIDDGATRDVQPSTKNGQEVRQ